MDDPGDLGQRGVELDLAPRDPRDVEQIVDEPGHVRGLPPDDLLLARSVTAQPHQLERGQDRRQGIAQLVPEERQEVVLGAIGGLGFGPGLSLVGQQALALLVGPALVRDVARDSPDPEQRVSLWVSDGEVVIGHGDGGVGAPAPERRLAFPALFAQRRRDHHALHVLAGDTAVKVADVCLAEVDGRV